MLFSCLIVAGCLANVYTGRLKKKRERDRLKNFVCTFATDMHTDNTACTSFQSLCTVKGSAPADDNVVFLLRDFYGRCACAVKVEGRHWGLVN